MSVRVREIYYYAICFVTLIITIFALTGAVNTLTDLAFPYPQYAPSKLEIIRMSEKTNPEVSDPAKLQELLVEEQQQQLEREKAAREHQVARELSRNVTLLLVAIPIYLYHWRRVRRMEGA